MKKIVFRKFGLIYLFFMCSKSLADIYTHTQTPTSFVVLLDNSCSSFDLLFSFKIKKENDGSDTLVQQTSSSSSRRKMTVKYASGLSVIASGLTVSEKVSGIMFIRRFRFSLW